MDHWYPCISSGGGLPGKGSAPDLNGLFVTFQRDAIFDVSGESVWEEEGEREREGEGGGERESESGRKRERGDERVGAGAEGEHLVLPASCPV